MKLKKIKTDICPHCGAEAILEERIRDDIDDENISEIREFECGMQLISASGNNDVDTTKLCPNSKEYRSKNIKILLFLKTLNNFIEGSDVDDDYKDNIRSILMRDLSSDI